MKVVITGNYEAASDWAARYVRKRITEFDPSGDRYFTLGLSSGERLIFCTFVINELGPLIPENDIMLRLELVNYRTNYNTDTSVFK